MAKLLIAVPQEIMIVGLRAILADRPDWQIVAEVSNGPDAIKLALEHKPDVMIADFFLPVISAVGVMKELKCKLPRMEVLVIGTDSDQDFLTESFLGGAKAYVLRNDPSYHILRAVKALLEHRAYFTNESSQTLLEIFLKNPSRNLLSSREQTILQMIAEGNTSKKISAILGISLKTVESHRSSLMCKTGASSVAHLVRYAIRNKVVDFCFYWFPMGVGICGEIGCMAAYMTRHMSEMASLCCIAIG